VIEIVIEIMLDVKESELRIWLYSILSITEEGDNQKDCPSFSFPLPSS